MEILNRIRRDINSDPENIQAIYLGEAEYAQMRQEVYYKVEQASGVHTPEEFYGIPILRVLTPTYFRVI